MNSISYASSQQLIIHRTASFVVYSSHTKTELFIIFCFYSELVLLTYTNTCAHDIHNILCTYSSPNICGRSRDTRRAMTVMSPSFTTKSHSKFA